MNFRKITILILIIAMLFAFSACSKSEGFSESDLIFEYNGSEYFLDKDCTPLITALGDDYEYEEAVSCAFSGMDKTYSYDGIDIYTYPLNGVDNIDEIYISSDKYSTSRGITVGSTLEDIKSIYGEEYTDLGGGMLVIAPEGNAEDTSDACIYFILDGNVVIEFSIYSASNRG